MKLLILGGTVFLGRHIVEAALARGHEITLFNRGQRNPELFPEVEKLHGDRDSNLEALRGRRWDAVIDTCGYMPRIVKASAELLAGAVDHYTFISTISVYADFSRPRVDEHTAVGRIEDETTEVVNGETYGPLKALCERAVEQVLPGRTLIIRPGLIVGPYDPTDRFTYWPHRIAQGGEVLAPGRPDRKVQFIDVRDLADWNVRMVEERQIGVYNAVGPTQPITMEQLLHECRAISGSDARFTWVDDQFLIQAGVGPFMEMPLWIPEEAPESLVISETSADKAFAAGLRPRPVAETIRDTLAWDATRPANIERRGGLKPERERELLRAWPART